MESHINYLSSPKTSISGVKTQVVQSGSFFFVQRFAVVGVVLATFFLHTNSFVNEVKTGLNLG